LRSRLARGLQEDRVVPARGGLRLRRRAVCGAGGRRVCFFGGLRDAGSLQGERGTVCGGGCVAWLAGRPMPAAAGLRLVGGVHCDGRRVRRDEGGGLWGLALVLPVRRLRSGGSGGRQAMCGPNGCRLRGVESLRDKRGLLLGEGRLCGRFGCRLCWCARVQGRKGLSCEGRTVRSELSGLCGMQAGRPVHRPVGHVHREGQVGVPVVGRLPRAGAVFCGQRRVPRGLWRRLQPVGGVRGAWAMQRQEGWLQGHDRGAVSGIRGVQAGGALLPARWDV